MQGNKPTNQETLKEQTDTLNSWTEELAKEVQNLEMQSEKHAAKQNSHKDDQAKIKEDVQITSKQETSGTENVNEATQSDSSQKTEDVVDSQEYLHVHSSDEHIKEENSKSDEQLDLKKSSDGNDKQDTTNPESQKTTDDKLDSGSESTEHLEDEEVKEKKKTSQSNKKKTKLKKGRGKKKTVEQEEMDEWDDEDDYGDDDEPYDEDMDEELDDDEPLEGAEDLDEEETDSIESWKMAEKPLDESENFGDEEDDSKIKEQEELQEEIKQLKGNCFKLRKRCLLHKLTDISYYYSTNWHNPQIWYIIHVKTPYSRPAAFACS